MKTGCSRTEAISPEGLRARWPRAWRALGLGADTALCEALLSRYQESHRAYHTLQHLGECLALLDREAVEAVHLAEIELALWFHDAIYDTQAADNEARSAAWAVTALRAQGAPAAVVQRVQDLIMATCHRASPAGLDAELLVDIDLAILGAEEARFWEFEAQVRQEYAWVPEAVFRQKRGEILQEFLGRAQLYSTPAIRTEREARARANLRAAISRLGDPAWKTP